MLTPHPLRLARFERACWWLDQGFQLLPLKPCSKHLQPGFGPHQACIADPVCARQWFLNTNANLGVVLGGRAGLAVADWDHLPDFQQWRATTGPAVHTLAERTARGFHLFFVGHGLTSAVGNGCEFKASGVCMVTPSTHPSGAVYRVVNDAPIAALDAPEARSLFPFLSQPPSPELPAYPTGVPITPQHTGLVARIKATRSILAELHAADVDLHPAGHDTLVGLCPFHDDHSPSLWVYPHTGLWGCNRPDCPAHGIHDVINFRARWRGISNRAAIMQLADELF
jgi:hypothetical protein